MEHHNYSLSDLENMMPWEREVYVTLLVNYIKEKEGQVEITLDTSESNIPTPHCNIEEYPELLKEYKNILNHALLSPPFVWSSCSNNHS